MQRGAIRKNQIWKNKNNGTQLLITGKKKGNKWNAKILTDRNDVYNGTHTMHERTLWKKFNLVV